MKRESGQVAVEFILLSIFIMATTIFIARSLRSQAILQGMISGPWSVLAGMIETGVWGTPEATRPAHPNNTGRHLSLKGEESR